MPRVGRFHPGEPVHQQSLMTLHDAIIRRDQLLVATHRQKAKRRVIAVGLHDAHTFSEQEPRHLRILIFDRAPCAAGLDLEHHADAVGRLKRRLRRAPGVEPEVIESV